VLKIVSLVPRDDTRTLYIFIDSQAVIRRLQGFSDLVQQAKAYCKLLCRRGIIVYFQWYPSHQGIYGNELVDMLAKQGLKAAPISKPMVSLSYIARRARRAIIEEWTNMWATVDHYNLQGFGKFYR
jgi:ribonuclease HI